jgi:hypothetical protein
MAVIRVRLAEAAGMFVAAAAAFHWMLARAPGLIEGDTLYHFKMARLIREHGPWVDVSWLPFTVLGERGPDQHWLFHLLIAPLTLLGNDLDAVQWTCALTGATVPAALVLALRRWQVPFAPLFAIVAVVASALLPARLIVLRAQDGALILMAAALVAFGSARAGWAALVAFLFMQAYHGAVILGLLLGAMVAAQLVLERRFDRGPIFGTLIGAFAGLVASPWFPRNIDYLVFHTFFKVATGFPSLVGTEWYGVNWAVIARESWIAHVVLLSGLAAVLLRRARLARETLATVGIVAALLVMYQFAWRFAEYYAPFAVVGGALLWRDAIGSRPPPRLAAVIASALLLLGAMGLTVGAQRVAAAGNIPFDTYAQIAHHIEAHDPAPVVFNTHWPDFTYLFFWSERARFTAGLDGHYLLYGDPQQFRTWYEIATGQTLDRADNASLMRDVFGAGWAVIPRGHALLAEALLHDPGAMLAFESREGWLFRLRPAVGATGQNRQ